MSDEEPIFDASLKKKKKKKRTPFDIDPTLGGEDNEEMNEEKGADDEQDAAADKDDLDDITNLTKKKKKKKKPFDLSELEEAVPTEEIIEEKEFETETLDVDMDAELDLTLPSKKRKKKKVVINLEEEETDIGKDEGTGKETKGKAWVDSDRDYTYEELLTRVFDIMREKNPEMVAGEKKRIVMKPPQVMRAGAKKTSFVNFTEISKMLHRQEKHLLAFLFAELGTSGSIDGSKQLIIKGKFQQKQIENVLRRYIKEYVTCHTCRSPDTILQKDTRLYFLQCETCGSRCSVASIKSGFQAVTSKRSVIRAKTT